MITLDKKILIKVKFFLVSLTLGLDREFKDKNKAQNFLIQQKAFLNLKIMKIVICSM